MGAAPASGDCHGPRSPDSKTGDLYEGLARYGPTAASSASRAIRSTSVRRPQRCWLFLNESAFADPLQTLRTPPPTHSKSGGLLDGPERPCSSLAFWQLSSSVEWATTPLAMPAHLPTCLRSPSSQHPS